MISTVVLICLSLVYSPRDPAECARLKTWPAIGLFCLELLVLWHWIWISFLLLGWLFLRGDRGSPLMDLVMPAAAILAATTAGMTTLRSHTCMATLNCYQVVVTLTIILLLLALASWLWRLQRLFA